MTTTTRQSRNPIKTFLGILAFGAAVLTLAGCETTGSGTAAQATKPPEPPMTHARAATECWMGTEKNHIDLDKRADIVTKCIDQKMKAAAEAPKT